MSCHGQALQGQSSEAIVATSIAAPTPHRFHQAFYPVVLVFLLLLSLPTTHAFRAIPIRLARAHPPVATPTSTRTLAMPTTIPAITSSGSGLRLLSSTGSSSSIPTIPPPPTTTERSSNPVAAADEDLPTLSTQIDTAAVLFADVITGHASMDDRMAFVDPGELIARLKASKYRSGMQSEQANGESFQALFHDIVTTKLDAFSLQDLATLIQASATQANQQPSLLPLLFDLLLDTTTLRMHTTLPPSLPPTGTTWVHLALASTSLPPYLKARPASHRFLRELTTDLPSRLSTLSPSDLVLAIQGWPRASADLDDFSCKLIQALLSQSINTLHTFDPATLTQLVQGLRRPMTPARYATLEALDQTGQETPDLNNRQRLHKAAIKQIARHIHQLSPRELSIFIQRCNTDLSFADWNKDLGVTFPRAYTTAAFKQIPHMVPLQLLPTLSAFLFLRSVFDSSPGGDAYQRLAKMAVEKVEEEGGKEGGREDPSVLLPLLHTFAMLAAPEYDPAEVLENLTEKVMRHLSSFPPSSLRCLVETLALPGHSYVPSSEVLMKISYHAASQLLSGGGVVAAAGDAITAATAADDESSVMVDYIFILRSLATIVGRKSAVSLGLGSGVREEKNELEEEEWREEREEEREGGEGSAMEGMVRKVQEFLRYFFREGGTRDGGSLKTPLWWFVCELGIEEMYQVD